MSLDWRAGVDKHREKERNWEHASTGRLSWKPLWSESTIICGCMCVWTGMCVSVWICLLYVCMHACVCMCVCCDENLKRGQPRPSLTKEHDHVVCHFELHSCDKMRVRVVFFNTRQLFETSLSTRLWQQRILKAHLPDNFEFCPWGLSMNLVASSKTWMP